MSLILDALRRSERERQRGLVPTIYSSHNPVGQRPRTVKWSSVALVSCALTLLGAQLWMGGAVGLVDAARLTARQAEFEPTAQPAAAAHAAAVPDAAIGPPPPASGTEKQNALEVAPAQPQPDVGNPPAAGDYGSAASSAPETPAEAKEAPRPIQSPPPPQQLARAVTKVETPSPSDARQRTRQQTAHGADRSGRQVVSPTIRSSSPPPAVSSRRQTGSPVRSERLPMLWELPEPIARSVPELQITMHVYSDDVSNRLLRVNGEMYREKDRVAQDLVLETITEGGAVMSYKGTRFQLEP